MSAVVAALGDSITAGSPLWDPSPAVRARIGKDALDESSQWPYWAERAVRGVEIRNAGVYGERTDEIAARLDDVVRGADALVVQGGINDLAQGREPREAARGLAAMVARARALGLPVALADVLPWNAGAARHAERIDALNVLLRDVAGREGAPLLPFHDTLADPRRHGRMRERWTSDGDHPSVEGYRRLGELAVAPWLRALPGP